MKLKDPYVLKNGTLKNLLGIEDYNLLKQAEADIGFAKLINVETVCEDDFDIALIKRIHKHIFEDIFEWAGEFRTVPLYKEEKYVIPGLSLDYTQPKDMESEIYKAIHELNSVEWKNKSLDEIAVEFTRYITKIWKIHPFRDGNTRTILSFAAIYAEQHGFPMDKSIFINRLSRNTTESGKTTYSVRDLFVFASLEPENYPEPEYLERLIKKSIISEHRNRRMKKQENEIENA